MDGGQIKQKWLIVIIYLTLIVIPICNSYTQIITPLFRIRRSQTSNIKVTHYFTDGQPQVKIYSIKFDISGKYIAAGNREGYVGGLLTTSQGFVRNISNSKTNLPHSANNDGQIKIFNVRKQSLSYTIDSHSNIPFTYICWRPQYGNFKTRNILTTVNSLGDIQNWHLTSGKCISTMRDDSQSTDKQLFCLDYNLDGTKLVTGGSEPIVRVYDEEKKVKDMELKESNAPHNCHTSRVYCTKFNRDPQLQYLIYSGGWDKTLIAWDIRIGKPVQSILGPEIYGDGISNCGMDLLTASWRPNKQLQQWDSRKCQLNDTLDWDGLKASNAPCFLYACQFSKKHQDLIIAGGSNANEVKLFDKANNNKPFCVIHGLPRQIGAVDFSYDDTMFAISGADGYVRVFTLSELKGDVEA